MSLSGGFLELLPDLLEDRADLESEMPFIPPALQPQMTHHLDALSNAIDFIERLGT